MEKPNTTDKDKKRDYLPMKPDPTSDPDNDVVADKKLEIKEPPYLGSAPNPEIGTSLVQRHATDDAD